MAETQYDAENPFESEENVARTNQPKTTTFAHSTTSHNYTHASNNFGFELTPEAIQRKELELARREEEISRKEKVLVSKEHQAHKFAERKKNWPPCKPIYYHNIAADMPTNETKVLMRKGYGGWFAIVVCYIWNSLSLLVKLVLDPGAGVFGSFFISLLWMVVSIPLSWFVYRTLYNAARQSKSYRYVIYYILLVMKLIVFIFLGLGVGYGGGGLFVMIGSFSDDQLAPGCFALICTAFWGLTIAWHIYILFAARVEHNKIGGMETAQKQFDEINLPV